MFVEKLILKHLLQALLIKTAFLRTFNLDLASYIALKQLFQGLLLLAADSGHCSVLMLLDLGAAFNTTDHTMLIHFRVGWAGRGVALLLSVIQKNVISQLIHSYIQLHSQHASYLKDQFSLYMMPVGDMICHQNIYFYCYADDTQLNLSINPPNATSCPYYRGA